MTSNGTVAGQTLHRERPYVVVLNHEEQYSIWPQDREVPPGWRGDGFAGPKQDCLAHIAEVWTDMRPLSLRRAMDADGRTDSPTPRTQDAALLAAPPVPRLSPPWALRTLGPEDGRTVADWMSRPHVRRGWDQDWGEERWRDELARQVEGDHSRPVAATRDGRDVAYLELYRVARDRLAGHYAHDVHDLGVHIALVEAGDCGNGLGSELLDVVAAALLVEDPDCVRIVAEPDELNRASVRAFENAGFRGSGSVVLARKTATLMRRERAPQSRP